VSRAEARRQGTVARSVFSEGPGLHTGKSHRVTINAADAGHGIVFRQINHKGSVTDIPAHWKYSKELPLCTCLAKGSKAQVRTVEHLLAACYACGVDNALIEVHGREIPILDGSAGPWIDLIRDAGVKRLDAPRRTIKVTKEVLVEEGRRQIRFSPSLRLGIRLRTSVRGMGTFHWKGPMNRKIFTEQISRARSFGSMRHGLLAKIFTRFHRDPLCQGANLKTVVAVTRKRVVNPEGLRSPNEFARHRVLDLMGDFMLGGTDIVALVTARSPVHSLNRAAIAALMQDPTAWEEVPAS
jgi:UDP-3-O-[3-hydroxymyristoyl] N-acetylglucosamine deacetylase